MTDLQTTVNNMAKARRNDAFGYKLINFIEDLEKVNPEKFIRYQAPIPLIPTAFDSWRGNYCDLALGFEIWKDHSPVLAKNLLQQAKECIGKEFEGYKGGEFVMSEDTPIYIANYGCSGYHFQIIGILENDYDIEILSAQDPQYKY